MNDDTPIADMNEPTKQLLTDLSDSDERAAAELLRVWENPADYERGATFNPDDALLPEREYVLLRLGIAFGIAFEHAYPTGRRDQWPVPVEERPTPQRNDTSGA